MSSHTKLSEQEQVTIAFFTLALVFLIVSLGPVVLCITILSMIILKLTKIRILQSLGLSAFAVASGMMSYQDFISWLTIPITMTHNFYAEAMPDGFFYMVLGQGTLTTFFSALGTQSLEWLSTPILWAYFLPCGLFFAAISHAALLYFWGSPLGKLKRQKETTKDYGKVGEQDMINLKNIRRKLL